MKLIFANNKSIDILQALASEEYTNGGSRSVLSFIVDPSSIELNELNIILSNADNIISIKIKDDTVPAASDGSVQEFIYNDYILYLKLEKYRIHNEEDVAQREQNEEIMFKIGKKTTQEKTLDAVLDQIDIRNIKV